MSTRTQKTINLTPVSAPVDRLQEIWSSLSSMDRITFLGHAEEELSEKDKKEFIELLSSIRKNK